MLEGKDFEFILGCCLGDGTIVHRRVKEERFRTDLALAHSISQESYIRWKANKVNQILNRKGSVRSYNSKANGKEYPSLMYSVSTPELRKAYSLLYREGRKTFSSDLLKMVGLQALALFWMDDGVFITRNHQTKSNRGLRTGQPGKKGITRKYFREARLSLYTGQPEAVLVKDWVKELTGANGYLYDQKNDGKYIIVWHKDEFLKIIGQIKVFVHPSMYRKISLDGKTFNLDAVTISDGESAAKLSGDR
jgi:hypothetical protein